MAQGVDIGAERCRAIFGLVVTADEVFAGVTAPEWERIQVLAMRIDLAAIGEASVNVRLASAAIHPHFTPSFPALIGMK
jgi:hypothetical protein